MQKVMATVGVVMFISTALAQTTPPPTSVAQPKKDNHGQIVSTAAHLDYEAPGKGRFISLIARLNNKSLEPVLKSRANAGNKAKTPRISQPDKRIAKAANVKLHTRPGQTRKYLLAQKPAPGTRSARVVKPNQGRKPAGAGRFTQVGRG